MSRTPRRKLPTKSDTLPTQRKLVRREPIKTQEDRVSGVMRTLYPASPPHRHGKAKKA